MTYTQNRHINGLSMVLLVVMEDGEPGVLARKVDPKKSLCILHKRLDPIEHVKRHRYVEEVVPPSADPCIKGPVTRRAAAARATPASSPPCHPSPGPNPETTAEPSLSSGPGAGVSVMLLEAASSLGPV